MKAFYTKPKSGPEDKIQREIIAFLQMRGWFVKPTHGNMYQSGFPDLFACHSSYGQRWIEVKNPLAYSFTGAQLIDFPKICANGSGVWVLVAATEEEYKKLFSKYNWYWYLSIMRG
ncbi:MAG: hypothetical protein M0R80_13260 [Proteobacteria bacterium]|jgi:hypothetical protein|nr:hypothetical protein [Pseudomonadota bacterium]